MSSSSSSPPPNPLSVPNPVLDPDPPVLLLLGAGSNLGAKIAGVFSDAGYKIALVARSLEGEGFQESTGYYHVRADLSDPECIPDVFEKVKRDVGIPGVVVYNAVQYKLDDATDPFSTLAPPTVSRFHTSMAVNGTTPLIALHHAIASFRLLPLPLLRRRPRPAGKQQKQQQQQQKQPGTGTFIFTGNLLNRHPVANRFSFGIAKATCAYGIRFAASSPSLTRYGTDEGFRFYYADERTAEGGPVMRDIDGDVAGRVYLQLAREEAQGPWLYTYTKDGGYRDFSGGGGGGGGGSWGDDDRSWSWSWGSFPGPPGQGRDADAAVPPGGEQEQLVVELAKRGGGRD